MRACCLIQHYDDLIASPPVSQRYMFLDKEMTWAPLAILPSSSAASNSNFFSLSRYSEVVPGSISSKCNLNSPSPHDSVAMAPPLMLSVIEARAEAY